jgi:hypothetical protein
MITVAFPDCPCCPQSSKSSSSSMSPNASSSSSSSSSSGSYPCSLCGTTSYTLVASGSAQSGLNGTFSLTNNCSYPAATIAGTKCIQECNPSANPCQFVGASEYTNPITGPPYYCANAPGMYQLTISVYSLDSAYFFWQVTVIQYVASTAPGLICAGCYSSFTYNGFTLATSCVPPTMTLSTNNIGVDCPTSIVLSVP